MFTAVQHCKEHEIDEGVADVIERGWLIKEGANDDSRRKRQVGNSYQFFDIFAPNLVPTKFHIIIKNDAKTRLLCAMDIGRIRVHEGSRTHDLSYIGHTLYPTTELHVQGGS